MSAATAAAPTQSPADESVAVANAVAEQESALWQPVMGLPCQLTVDLPFPGFKTRDFLGLRTGSVVETRWGLARDLPIRVNGVLIAWGELEGAGSRLAVRLTEVS